MPSEKYEIYINESGVSDKPTVAPSPTPADENKSVSRYIASTIIKPVISSGIELVTTQFEAATGSRRLQEQVNLVKGGVNTAIGAVQAVLGGAATGGATGAAAGLILYSIMQGIKVVSQRITLGLEHQNEAEELAIARDRAGIQYSGGR